MEFWTTLCSKVLDITICFTYFYFCYNQLNDIQNTLLNLLYELVFFYCKNFMIPIIQTWDNVNVLSENLYLNFEHFVFALQNLYELINGSKHFFFLICINVTFDRQNLYNCTKMLQKICICRLSLYEFQVWLYCCFKSCSWVPDLRDDPVFRICKICNMGLQIIWWRLKMDTKSFSYY